MQSRSLGIVCALALICLFVPRAAKADSVAIQDSNFSENNPSIPTTGNCGVGCNFVGMVPAGWSATGTVGIWVPGSNQFNSNSLPPNGETTFAYANGGTLWQNLGVALLPDSTYTLSVYVGDRGDENGMLDSNYSLGLAVGSSLASSTTLASTPFESTGTIPGYTFAQETVSFTTDSTVTPGDLIIYFSNNTAQASFGDVSLNVTTPEPSSLIMLAIGLIGLLGLAKRYGLKPVIQVSPVS